MQKKLRFALIGNEFQTEKSASIQQVLECLEMHDAEVSIEAAFFAFLHRNGMLTDVQEKQLHVFDGADFQADFVLSLGGDGTFLKAASYVGMKQVPIIGINMGRLGFLADVPVSDVKQAFEAICKSNYQIEHHAALEMRTEGQKDQQDKLTRQADNNPHNSDIKNSPYALNDIAVLKRDNASMITIHATINDEPLATYQADGLVVSTPTGSTAYNLSVGGPIIAPLTRVICLTPVAPHSLNIRPIVVDDNVVIKLSIESRSGNFLVAIDGRSQTLSEHTTVIIRKAPFTINTVKLPSRTYFTTLREKMMWGIDGRLKS